MNGRSQAKKFFGSSTFAVCMLGALLFFYLWFEHRAHLLGALPYLILLACPLMHLWGHGGHGKDGGEHDGHKELGAGTAEGTTGKEKEAGHEHKGAGCH